jgi:hypothetical protein
MPKFPLSSDQIADLATFLHSFAVAGYDTSRQRPATIVVGNAAAGEAAFKTKCASCHSTTGDLQGVATRMADPRTLQQSWLMPGSTVGRGGGPMPARSRPPTAIVTLPSGQKFEGELERVDDFFVAIRPPTAHAEHFARPMAPGLTSTIHSLPIANCCRPSPMRRFTT